MENLLYLPLLLLVAIVYKVAANWRYRKRLRDLRQVYQQYLEDTVAKDHKPDWSIVEQKEEVVELFRRAGLSDSRIVRPKLIGYGQVHNQELGIFDNIVSDDGEITIKVVHYFHMADGVYTKRIKEAFSPFYWTETILFLPSKLMKYVGFPADTVVARLANVIVGLAVVATFLFNLPDFSDLRDNVSKWLAELVGLGGRDG